MKWLADAENYTTGNFIIVFFSCYGCCGETNEDCINSTRSMDGET